MYFKIKRIEEYFFVRLLKETRDESFRFFIPDFGCFDMLLYTSFIDTLVKNGHVSKDIPKGKLGYLGAETIYRKRGYSNYLLAISLTEYPFSEWIYVNDNGFVISSKGLLPVVNIEDAVAHSYALIEENKYTAVMKNSSLAIPLEKEYIYNQDFDCIYNIPHYGKESFEKINDKEFVFKGKHYQINGSVIDRKIEEPLISENGRHFGKLTNSFTIEILALVGRNKMFVSSRDKIHSREVSKSDMVNLRRKGIPHYQKNKTFYGNIGCGNCMIVKNKEDKRVFFQGKEVMLFCTKEYENGIKYIVVFENDIYFFTDIYPRNSEISTEIARAIEFLGEN